MKRDDAWRDDAWIVWDKTVFPIMQHGPIGTEEVVREEVRKREAFRKTQGSCLHEITIRYEARRLVVEGSQEPEWSDTPDEWSKDIKAAFPTRSGSHEHYATAMQLVGNRHSKGELVALVNWLLVLLEKAKK